MKSVVDEEVLEWHELIDRNRLDISPRAYVNNLQTQLAVYVHSGEGQVCVCLSAIMMGTTLLGLKGLG